MPILRCFTTPLTATANCKDQLGSLSQLHTLRFLFSPFYTLILDSEYDSIEHLQHSGPCFVVPFASGPHSLCQFEPSTSIDTFPLTLFWIFLKLCYNLSAPNSVALGLFNNYTHHLPAFLTLWGLFNKLINTRCNHWKRKCARSSSLACSFSCSLLQKRLGFGKCSSHLVSKYTRTRRTVSSVWFVLLLRPHFGPLHLCTWVSNGSFCKVLALFIF